MAYGVDPKLYEYIQRYPGEWSERELNKQEKNFVQIEFVCVNSDEHIQYLKPTTIEAQKALYLDLRKMNRGIVGVEDFSDEDHIERCMTITIDPFDNIFVEKKLNNGFDVFLEIERLAKKHGVRIDLVNILPGVPERCWHYENAGLRLYGK